MSHTLRLLLITMDTSCDKLLPMMNVWHGVPSCLGPHHHGEEEQEGE